MTKIKHIPLHNPIEKQFSKIRKYHYYLFILLFASKIPLFWHVLNLIFLSPPMHYTCEGKNATDPCDCDEPLWDRSVFTETMQTKFGLFCDNSWLISLSHSIMYVGLLIGALVFGILSDKYGRLNIFTLSILIVGISGSLLSFMPSIMPFVFLRFIEGIGSGGAIVTSYVLCVEYCSVHHRSTITALYHVPVNISHMTLPVVSYLLRNFDHFQLALSIPVLCFVPLRWLIMESPKWLMDCGRIDNAVDVMEKFGAFNNRPCNNIRQEIEAYNAKKSNEEGGKIPFLKVFEHRALVLNLCYMSVLYFLSGLGYYGVSQYIGKQSGNIHLNVAISGAILLPGTFATLFLLKTLNRRTFLMATNFLSGLFILVEICIPHSLNWLKIACACICNTFFSISFIIVFLYAVELFPTAVRNSVLGFLSVWSRIGQILAPVLNEFSGNTSGIIIGVLALIGTIFCFLLPETKNIELPSSLGDSKLLTRRRSSQVEDNTENDGTLQFREK